MALYLDFESTYDKSTGFSLSQMPLRHFLVKTELLTLCCAIDDGEVITFNLEHPPQYDAAFEFLKSHRYNTWVAHNAPFDVRVAVIKMKLPWPRTVHCSLELAQAWSPNQPGGYSLANLSTCWNLQYPKQDIDLMHCTHAQREEYCRQDVRACRELYQEALRRLPPEELRICALAKATNALYFEVDRPSVVAAVDELTKLAVSDARGVAALLGDSPLFGTTDDSGDLDQIKSVKPAKIKEALLDKFGFDTRTITLKKQNHDHLRQAVPQVSEALGKVALVSKALSHRTRVKSFVDTDIVDCQLTYFAAHTGRFSSRNDGKGLNLHNMPKRNPVLAKTVRSMFSLPDGQVFVRGDFANVEYRVTGWLCDCAYTKSLFSSNPLADPYNAFGYDVTGKHVDKKDPARQIWKAAVLGLGFMMGLERWTNELLIMLAAYETYKVTLKDLQDVCASNGWGTPQDRHAKSVLTKTKAPWEVVAVAYHSRRRFHEIHPEFMRLAKWLEYSVNTISGTSGDPAKVIDMLYTLNGAPDRAKLELSIDDTLQGRSCRVKLAGWHMPTVTWRDLGVRETKKGVGLSVAHVRKGWEMISLSTLIENCAQSCARNGLCYGMLKLGDKYPMLSVHDEALLVTGEDCASILDARKALLDVYGPGNGPMEWAVVIKPGDVTVSKTLYEDEEAMKTIWPRIEAGDATVLQELP